MDETQKERRLRQQREAVARYRARHPDKARASAAAGRAANIEEVRRRDRETKARWREKNREESRARSNAWGAANREAAKAKSAAWRRENPDRVKELAAAGRLKRKERWAEFLAQERARYHKDPTKKLERQRETRPQHAERMAAYHREWSRVNRAKCVAYVSARRASRMNATPPWCDRAAILAMFKEARRLTIETGIKHEVDHIVPLRGKNVCGLHIALNMQIITGTENRRKHNKLVHNSDKAADRPWLQAA